MYDVNDPIKRIEALELLVKEPDALKQDAVLAGDEPDPLPDPEEESDHEEDEHKDELDTTKNKPEGTRKSARNRRQAAARGYMVNSERVHMSDDSADSE
jgi:hypothetical protein